MYGQVKQVNIGDAEINYIEAGTGVPVLFIHAGLDDYRMWESVMGQLQGNYHVIALSRRYNYPNKNTVEISNFSAESEADDLAAFSRKLNLKPAHIVGHAFGGLVALTFAHKEPDNIRNTTDSMAERNGRRTGNV